MVLHNDMREVLKRKEMSYVWGADKLMNCCKWDLWDNVNGVAQRNTANAVAFYHYKPELESLASEQLNRHERPLYMLREYEDVGLLQFGLSLNWGLRYQVWIWNLTKSFRWVMIHRETIDCTKTLAISLWLTRFPIGLRWAISPGHKHPWTPWREAFAWSQQRRVIIIIWCLLAIL